MEEGRLRPFGQLRAQRLKERQEGFVLQLDAGCCPGCGVKLQCTDKMALGYIPPDKIVQEEEEDESTKPLNAEDEVALLLKEDGAVERNSFELATTSSQRDFKVIANVFLDIRTEPDVNAERTGESLAFGEQFQVGDALILETFVGFFVHHGSPEGALVIQREAQSLKSARSTRQQYGSWKVKGMQRG